MNIDEPGIILITGIMAAGKSTVAQHLAEQLPKSVHLRGDVFRRMIVSGRVEMSPDTMEAGLRQLMLRYQVAVTAADLYCKAGFTVVYQDIIIGPVFQDVVDMLIQTPQPVYVIVLCPTPDVVARREAGREKTGYGAWTPDQLDHELRTNTPHYGLWLDTSALSVEETVDAILGGLDEAAVRK